MILKMQSTADGMLWAEQFEQCQQDCVLHMHSELTIGLITEGKRKMEIFGFQKELTPGTLFLVPAWTAHACSGLSHRPVSWKSLRVISDWHPAQFFIRDPECLELFEILHARVLRKETVEDLPEKLLCLLQKKAGTTVNPGNESLSGSAASLPDWVLQHSQFSLSQKQLAEKLHRSAAALQRDAARTYGLSLHRILLSCRAEQARRRMEMGESPAETACSLGFCDQPHFSHVFASIMGCPPALYRKESMAGRPARKRGSE